MVKVSLFWVLYVSFLFLPSLSVAQLSTWLQKL